ncbi:S-adenosyl-L-methionine-dependent methyltransferase [Jimgerdemannia flammicorona]|uniref:S-adenosyl-L-methionine-dependent methyltransferase n=1 Tax=Jimgerdemannia flammicorona TaxID=994334 RepID=A0A433Q7V5_9FUNG|nr:S-adenosyl-L-methionine-dependent methyltransferase [Jimgerdemannia flammicorona]
MGHFLSTLCHPSLFRPSENEAAPSDDDSTMVGQVSGRTSGGSGQPGMLVVPVAGPRVSMSSRRESAPRLSGSLRFRDAPVPSRKGKDKAEGGEGAVAGLGVGEERLDGRYVWAGERRFLRDQREGAKGANFLVPMDEMEGEGWVKRHELLRYSLARNYNAPVADILTKGGRVLEIGCGTGAWTLDMANTFSNSRFTGLSSADLFPKWNAAAPNCRFQTLDATRTALPFSDGEFDLVFQRNMALEYTVTQWLVVLTEIARVLKPGGYVEFVECDIKIKGAGEVSERWFEICKTICASRRIDPRVFRRLPTFLTDTGLAITKEETFNLPVGQWGGYIGESWAKDLETRARGLRAAFVREGGVTEAEFDGLVDAVADGYRRLQSGLNVHVMVARKPEAQQKATREVSVGGFRSVI